MSGAAFPRRFASFGNEKREEKNKLVSAHLLGYEE